VDLIQRATLLNYGNYRYLKALGWLVGVAIVAYVVIDPVGGEPYGGTWLGYVLGVISLLIVFLLTWYGITKRRTPKNQDRRHYQISERRKREAEGESVRKRAERRKQQAKQSWHYGGTLQGWLSAHIYLGASLIVLATLHAGFQFGWNIHTLSYALMLLVIASGFFGTYAYLNYPRQMTQNMGQDTLGSLIDKIDELDESARIRALDLPDDVNALVFKARTETRLGGNLFQQINGKQHNCPTEYASQQVLLLGKTYTQDDQPKLMRDLYLVLLNKEKLLLRARTEIKLKARLGCWLYIHVPLAIAMFAALFAHIVAIYFYW